jgi:hypothetical protein
MPPAQLLRNSGKPRAGGDRDRNFGLPGARQAIIDGQWELKLIQKEHAREEAERRSFHKAPGDADWNIK